YLLVAANTWRMPIAPSGFDQNTPRPTIASLGDAAAVDRVACGAFGGYETEIPHQLAGVLKARQIADLGQHRHCRNEIYPAHRLQGCDDLGKGSLGHRVTDRLLQTLDTLALLAHCPRSSSSAICCSRCSSFCSMSQFMWARPHVFLPG